MSKITNFVAGVFREMKRVRWLTISELVRNTGIILSIMTLFGMFFLVSDFIFLIMLRAPGYGV